jgi:hypothetical protein
LEGVSKNIGYVLEMGGWWNFYEVVSIPLCGDIFKIRFQNIGHTITNTFFSCSWYSKNWQRKLKMFMIIEERLFSRYIA